MRSAKELINDEVAMETLYYLDAFDVKVNHDLFSEELFLEAEDNPSEFAE
jgi:hypothetical protein